MTEEQEQQNIELDQCKKQAEEYLNNWKRERADFVNYKKDEARRMEEFLKFSSAGILVELLDVVDGIEVARKNIPDVEELKDWLNGFDSALAKLDEFLKKFGVEKINVAGSNFNPLLHEAVTTEIQNKEGNMNERIEEIRPGYIMHGKVIRPARVRIIK